METHNNDDPIEGPTSDPWDRVGEQFGELRAKLKDAYRQQPGDTGPDEDEVKDAFRTLGRAWDRLADAVGSAVRDEEVRHQAKAAANGFFEAVGSAFTELGRELRKSRSPEDDQGVPPAS